MSSSDWHVWSSSARTEILYRVALVLCGTPSTPFIVGQVTPSVVVELTLPTGKVWAISITRFVLFMVIRSVADLVWCLRAAFVR